MAQDTLGRLKRQIRQAWRTVSGLQWRVLAVLLAVALASALVATLVGNDKQTWQAALLNFGTELAGAVVTFIMLQLLVGGRARKEELIAQMGSDVRDVAVPAADELRRRGWLTDGSLIGADLIGADLSGADLIWADLSGANLIGATVTLEQLEQAANLTGTIMRDGTKHE